MLMGGPLLTLYIPTRNSAGTLFDMLEALSAALSASPELSYEVVFRDDASTDLKPAVIRDFAKNHPVQAYRHEESVGVTRNILSCSLEGQGGTYGCSVTIVSSCLTR